MMKTLITGASGQLGAYVLPKLAERGHEMVAWTAETAGERSGVTLRPVDLADAAAVWSELVRFRPDAILHMGAISAAEAVRRDPERARAVNVEGTATLARWAGETGARLVFTSTDLVFDGEAPWRKEDDPAVPILEYGRTKRLAEDHVTPLSTGVVARVCLLYGPSRCGREAFFDRTMAGLARGEAQTLFNDEYRTPLDLDTAAEILIALVKSDFSGVIHVAGRDRMSRFEFVRRVAEALGLDGSLVRANRRSEAALAEPRPADVSLNTDKLAALFPGINRPEIETALDQMQAGPKPR